ncbi:MAG: methylaspartate mutase subunit E, partial [Proteiniphilum sp.]|nr:methylaspartate mutase subunit E [Proteiniphilum sp.]
MEIKNKKLTNDHFFAQREEVLKQWATGSNVDFNEAVAYQKSIPAEKRFGVKLEEGVKENKTLIQPRAGVALYDEHIKLLQYLETEGEADLLPTTVDSYTRLNRYEEAENGIAKS